MAADPGCPSLEDIAAFVDGRLEGAARQQVADHLADRCDVCYRVYVDTLRFQQESQEARPGADVVTGRFGNRKRLLWLAGPLAAAAAVLLIIGLPRPALDGSLPVAGLTEALPPALTTTEGWYEVGWPSTRGPVGQLDPRERALRLGARAVDLHLALTTDDAEPARLLVDRTIRLLEDVPGAGALLTSRYRDLRGDLSSTPPAELADRATELDREGETVFEEPSFYRLGKWAEAGRLAARETGSTLLANPAFRRFPESFATETLGVGSRQTLADLTEALGKPRGESPPAELEALFTELLVLGGVR